MMLGRFCRLLVVNIHSVWDRRIDVSDARKLADETEFRSVFTKADEPPEVRRRKTNRLKEMTKAGNVVERDDISMMQVPSISLVMVRTTLFA